MTSSCSTGTISVVLLTKSVAGSVGSTWSIGEVLVQRSGQLAGRQPPSNDCACAAAHWVVLEHGWSTQPYSAVSSAMSIGPDHDTTAFTRPGAPGLPVPLVAARAASCP